ncbi:hypothetical protein PIB30_063952 [Stylosanthes scabra]|uniref:Uncharacterized protein n=1 Tax=Stylosanthes scabra TaxID=79078 RepID=A0ABU6UNA6_9FABA|nr:hypothetical protein [Stylosanthes scabra]
MSKASHTHTHCAVLFHWISRSRPRLSQSHATVVHHSPASPLSQPISSRLLPRRPASAVSTASKATVSSPLFRSPRAPSSAAVLFSRRALQRRASLRCCVPSPNFQPLQPLLLLFLQQTSLLRLLPQFLFFKFRKKNQ